MVVSRETETSFTLFSYLLCFVIILEIMMLESNADFNAQHYDLFYVYESTGLQGIEHGIRPLYMKCCIGLANY